MRRNSRMVVLTVISLALVLFISGKANALILGKIKKGTAIATIFPSMSFTVDANFTDEGPYFKKNCQVKTSGGSSNPTWEISDGGTILYSGSFANIVSPELDEISNKKTVAEILAYITLLFTTQKTINITMNLNHNDFTELTIEAQGKITNIEGNITGTFAGTLSCSGSTLIPPQLNLYGDNPVYHAQGTEYVDAGVEILAVRSSANYFTEHLNILYGDGFPAALVEREAPYTVSYNFKDSGGIDAEEKIREVIVVNVPTVVSTFPQNNASGGINIAEDMITIVFSEDVIGVNETSFYLEAEDSPETKIEGTVNYQNRKATFKPDSPLSFGKKYYVTATEDITREGNSSARLNVNGYTWSFITPSQANVISLFPNDAATGATINTNISATFSEIIDISHAILTVINNSTGLNTEGTFAIASTNMAVIFTPNAPLAYNTTYSATLKDVTDGVGNPTQFESYSWSFTTEPDPNPGDSGHSSDNGGGGGGGGGGCFISVLR